MFDCEFYAVAVPDSENQVVSSGYKIGSKRYRKITEFKADVAKAFGKTLPNGDALQIIVTYKTNNHGKNTVKLLKTNYATMLTAIETSITAVKWDLDTLLA